MSLNQEFTGDINVLGEIKKNGVAVGGGVYLHKILFGNSQKILIYSSDSTPFDLTTLAQFLKNNGFNGDTKHYGYSLQADSLYVYSSTELYFYCGVYSQNGTDIKSTMWKIKIAVGTGYDVAMRAGSDASFTSDTVIEM